MKLFSIFHLMTLTIVANANLTEIFLWNQLEFQWPSETMKQNAIASGEYVPENNLPLSMARWEDKMFIAVPRLKNGVASTLNYFDLKSLYKGERSPMLIPYPSWDANYAPTANTCKNNVCEQNSSIVSAFGLQVDKCDRLWVLDTGLVDITGTAQQVSENAILIFDLKTDKLIRRFNIPTNQLESNSFLPNILVDVDAPDCTNAYAYIPDLGGNSFIVYSFKDNDSHRFSNTFFYFHSTKGAFSVSNIKWDSGVFAMTIGSTKSDGCKDVYFNSFGSIHEFKVSNRVLQNKTLATDSSNYLHFSYVGSRGEEGESSCEIYDGTTDFIFYSEFNKNRLSCWGARTSLDSSNLRLIDSNSEILYVSDMKIDHLTNLWLLSSRMSDFLRGQLDPENVNFHLLLIKTRQLVATSRHMQ